MTQFPPEGGRMGHAIRTKDWSETSLGEPDGWPPSLKNIVRMVLAQRHAICLFWGPDLSIIYNDSYAQVLAAKASDALGRPFREVWSDVWDDVVPFVDEDLSGKGTWSEDLPLVMNRHGYAEETFWTFSYSPLYDDDGAVAGLINVALETTAAVQSRRSQLVLQRELQHRVKNMMAVVSAVVSSSLRDATSIESAKITVRDRIRALGKAQDLLNQRDDNADVRDIVSSGISAYVDRHDRITVDGPATTVGAQQAVGLSMAIFELATNAVKYGALSGDSGKVAISWETRNDRSFRFVWQEHGGPVVTKPTKTGFGSRLTTSIVAAYFSGTGETDYLADGLRYELNGTIMTGHG